MSTSSFLVDQRAARDDTSRSVSATGNGLPNESKLQSYSITGPGVQKSSRRVQRRKETQTADSPTQSVLPPAEVRQRADTAQVVPGAKALSAKEGVRHLQPSDYRVGTIQTWTGRVKFVSPDYFTAELTPDNGGLTLMADFPASLIDARDDLGEGDVVYVTSRSVGTATGKTRHTSNVRLRRAGRWTAAEVESQWERAESARSHLLEAMGESAAQALDARWERVKLARVEPNSNSGG